MSAAAPAGRHAAAGAALLRCFDQIRIINLADRADRRREVTEELGRLGLTIDGARITFHLASRFDDAGPFSSIGARGCFDSHLRLIEAALAGGAERLLILEDDVWFRDPAGRDMAAVIDRLAAERWDLAYGGYNPAFAPPDIGGPLATAPPGEGFQGAHCLGLSRTAMTLLVPYLRTMRERAPGDPAGGPMHVDGAYNWFRRDHPQLVTRYARPLLADQRPSRSDIRVPGRLDRLRAIAPLVHAARRLKHHLVRRG